MPYTTKEKTEEFVKFSIRVPKELHDSLVELAASQERTLNGEITRILRQALADWKNVAPKTTDIQTKP